MNYDSRDCPFCGQYNHVDHNVDCSGLGDGLSPGEGDAQQRAVVLVFAWRSGAAFSLLSLPPFHAERGLLSLLGVWGRSVSRRTLADWLGVWGVAAICSSGWTVLVTPSFFPMGGNFTIAASSE